MTLAAALLVFLFLAERYPVFYLPPVLMLLFAVGRKRKRTALICAAAIAAGVLIRVLEPPYPEHQTSYFGIVISRRENYFLFWSCGKRYYVPISNHSWEPGDLLRIHGSGSAIVNTALEGEFSFQEYLFSQNIERRIAAESIDAVWMNPLRMGKWISEYLELYSEEGRYLYGKMVFNVAGDGYDDRIFAWNLSYLVSFGGIYLYTLHRFLKIVWRNLMKHREKAADRIAFFSLLPLILISGCRISLLKAALLIANRELWRGRFRKEEVLSSFLILLMIGNRRYVFSASFAYIFLGSYLRIVMETGLAGYPEKMRKTARIAGGAMIFSCIEILLNGSLNPVSILLMAPAVAAMKAVFLLFFLLPHPLIVNGVSSLMLKSLSLLMKEPPVLYFSEYGCFVACFGLLLFFLWCYFSELALVRAAVRTGWMLLGWFFLCASPIESLASQYVAFLNVGQGDAILIHDRMTDVLIDTGGLWNKDIATEVLIPFFQSHHISDIDAVFISHEDYDHCGALPSLQEHFSVKAVTVGSSFYSQNVGNLKFTNLNRFFPGAEENKNSSVLYVEFLGMNFLFMGDADSSVEEKILHDHPSLTADIVKLGHHGSDTSSSYEFLKSISPSEAVISVGRNNRYGHPSDAVLQRLRLLGIRIRRTDEEGSIFYRKSV